MHRAGAGALPDRHHLPRPGQCESMLGRRPSTPREARYYPAFQFVVWGRQGARPEAMTAAMFDTEGEGPEGGSRNYPGPSWRGA